MEGFASEDRHGEQLLFSACRWCDKTVAWDASSRAEGWLDNSPKRVCGTYKSAGFGWDAVAVPSCGRGGALELDQPPTSNSPPLETHMHE